MDKKIQRYLIAIAILDIIVAVYAADHISRLKEALFTVLPGMLVFNFFMYKLLAGWLIVNMNVKIEAERLPIAGSDESDHLALKVTLTKGSIDSIWMKSIEIRLSQLQPDTETPFYQELTPINAKKIGDEDQDYWGRNESPFYTISSGEEAIFSAYTIVPRETVLAAQLLVLGTRLFYGVETNADKRIQWRSSLIILPIPPKTPLSA